MYIYFRIHEILPGCKPVIGDYDFIFFQDYYIVRVGGVVFNYCYVVLYSISPTDWDDVPVITGICRAVKILTSKGNTGP